MRIPYYIYIITYLIFGLPVSYFVLTLEPYSGDLTRVGAFSENDYGWNAPQKVFSSSEVVVGKNISDYNRYYYIFVVGDSFSAIPENNACNWQDFLLRTTSANLISYHQNNIDIHQLTESKFFKEYPPKFFIYEAAEHGVQDILHGYEQFSSKENSSVEIQCIREKYVPYAMGAYYRAKENLLTFDTAIHYIKINVKNNFSSKRKSTVYPLNKKCFSSLKGDYLLAYYGDLKKLAVGKNEWGIISKRFRGLKNLIETNNCTNFILMIAPDKSTIYKHYIDGEHPFICAMDQLDLQKVTYINLKHVLQTKVAEGILDVYLPNDTHWGYAGHQVAAQQISNYICEIITP